MNVTVSNEHGLESGQSIIMVVDEDRWWKLFFYWIVRKNAPFRKKRFVITKLLNNTSFDII